MRSFGPSKPNRRRSSRDLPARTRASGSCCPCRNEPPAVGSEAWRFLTDELVGVIERIESAGVGPVAVEDAVTHAALLEIMIVHIGDLEFAAPAGLERLDEAEYVRRVGVDADDRQIALGLRRFL